MDKLDKIDAKVLGEEKSKNFKERIWFIKYWADYVKTHPDEEWSRGQADLIDSQIESAKDFHSSKIKGKSG